MAAEFASLDNEYVLAAIATYRANVARFSGPGALVFYLRNGSWPAEVVDAPDPAIAARRHATAATARAQQAEADRRAACLERDMASWWASLPESERLNLAAQAKATNQFLARLANDSPLVIDLAWGIANETLTERTDDR
jgi:hypothetical protein